MESRVKEWKIFVRVSLNGVQNKKKGKRQDVIASRKKMSKKERNSGGGGRERGSGCVPIKVTANC